MNTTSKKTSFSVAAFPIFLCVLGFALTLYSQFPGGGGHDLSVQHAQNETGIYSDWHPPLMAATLYWCNTAFNAVCGTDYTWGGVLFVAFNIVFWTGLGLILFAGQSFWTMLWQRSRIVYLALLTLLGCVIYFDLIGWVSLLGKDLGMLAFYALGIGLLFQNPERKISKIVIAIVVLFCFAYGTALRHNAIFSLFPLVCWVVWKHFTARSFLRVGLVSTVVWIAILVAIHFTNYGILRSVKLFPLQERFYADIFLLNHITGDYVAPPNTFGNDFTKLSEEEFFEYYVPVTFVLAAFREINANTDMDFDFAGNIYIMPGSNPNPAVHEHVTYPWFGRNGQKDTITLRKEYLDDIRNRYPEDYRILRAAWIERIAQSPYQYVLLRLKTFRQFCLQMEFRTFGIDCWKILILVSLSLLPSLFQFRQLLRVELFPRTMLAIAALFYILPYLVFLTDDMERYVFWFLGASMISLILFCYHSPLMRSIGLLILSRLKRTKT